MIWIVGGFILAVCLAFLITPNCKAPSAAELERTKLEKGLNLTLPPGTRVLRVEKQELADHTLDIFWFVLDGSRSDADAIAKQLRMHVIPNLEADEWDPPTGIKSLWYTATPTAPPEAVYRGFGNDNRWMIKSLRYDKSRIWGYLRAE